MAARRLSFLSILRLLRPRQWTKNLLVFAALVFARQYEAFDQVLLSLRMFFAFCLASSALYVVNDMLDRPFDRLHPVRRLRPLASGAVHVSVGLLIAPILGVASLLLVQGLPVGSGLVLTGYLVLGLLYSFVLRRVVIADVISIALGFVLRAAAGAVAIAVEISPWLLLCTMLLALFLAIAKRRSELVSSSSSFRFRPVLSSYSLPLLDQMLGIAATATLVGYLLYSFSDQTFRKFPSGLMPVSSVFVLYGIFRYLHLVHLRNEGGEPERLVLTDRPLIIGLILYLVSVFVAVSS